MYNPVRYIRKTVGNYESESVKKVKEKKYDIR